jgi:hypothetical protein
MSWILNNDIVKHLLKTYLPYLIAFLLGVIVAWKGCGDTSGKPITTVIEKPVPVIEYVDRWKEKPVRYVETKVVTVHDTVQVTVHDVRLDTLFLIDTLKIVEAWLTEVTKYDTTASFETADIRLRWQNYQNFSENVRIDYTPNIRNSRIAIGMHAKVGLVSDFKMQYTPMIGAGIGFKIKNNYLTADYGYLQQHYVGVTYGRYFLNF